jgi:hypothetical protein
MAHPAFTLPWLQFEDMARAVIGVDGDVAVGIAWRPASVRAAVPRTDGDEQDASVHSVASRAPHGLDHWDVRVGFATILRRLRWARLKAPSARRW